VRAFLVELGAIVDRVRAVAIACFVAGAIVVAMLLAANPAISIGDGGWIILAGITVSSAWQVYTGRREAGRPEPAAWGAATAAGLVLAIGGVWGLSLLLRPAVEGGSLAANPGPAAVAGWLVPSLGAVLWARGRQQRSIVAVLALSLGTVLAAAAALRTDAIWAPIAVIVLLLGLGVFISVATLGLQERARGRAVQAARLGQAADPTPTRATPVTTAANAPGRAAARSVKRGRRGRGR
jgi:hypothetical protein